MANGSSPLTRGKRSAGPAGRHALRLIPAHAGKTFASRLTARATAAHPRSRGENQYAAARDSLTRGSSPLTRGKPPEVAEGHPVVGLIPAHAGKTGRPPGAGAPWTAHPRSRGENRGHPRDCQMNRGSSPLTRGKLGFTAAIRASPRLIPAHAGKTSGERLG